MNNKFRIVDIHPQDAFYPNRDDLIGILLENVTFGYINLVPGMSRWCGLTATLLDDIHYMDSIIPKGSTAIFLAVQVEPVYD